eukprot:10744_1
MFKYTVMTNETKKRQLLGKINNRVQIRAHLAYKMINRKFCIEDVRNVIALGFYGLKDQGYEEQNNMNDKQLIRLLADIFHMTSEQFKSQLDMWKPADKDEWSGNAREEDDCTRETLDAQTSSVTSSVLKQQANKKGGSMKEEMEYSDNDDAY